MPLEVSFEYGKAIKINELKYIFEIYNVALRIRGSRKVIDLFENKLFS